MATHDYVIDNSTGANVRADINSVLQAILTNNSSSSAPSTTAAYMFWADTTSGTLKIRNSSDNAWVELLQIDGTLTLEDGSASTPALAFRDDLNTGLYQDTNDTLNFSTSGSERLELGGTTVFNDIGADVDFRIEGDADANLFYVDAGNDRVGICTSSPTPNKFHVVHSDYQVARLENTNADANGSYIEMFANSSSPADNDVLGLLAFRGNNSAGENTLYTTIRSLATDVTDGTEDGVITFQTRVDGTMDERMRIDSSGRLLIGTTVEGNANADDLTIASSGETGITIRSGTSNRGRIFFSDATSGNAEFAGFISYEHNNNALAFGSNESERLRIDSSGRLLIGTTTNTFTGVGSSRLQVSGTGADTAGINLVRTSNDAGGAYLQFTKNRGSATQSGDTCGAIAWMGHDGTDVESYLAQLIVKSDATATSNSMTGRMEFHTANGSSITSERMRIDSAGRLLLGTTTEGHSAADDLTIENTSADMGITLRSGTSGQGAIYFSDGTSGDDEYRGIINYNHATNFFSFFTNATERMRLHNSNQLQIGGTTLINSSPYLTLGQSGNSQGNIVHFVNNGTQDLIASFISANKNSRAIGIDVSTDNFFIGRDSSDNDLAISNSGQVLIGTFGVGGGSGGVRLQHPDNGSSRFGTGITSGTKTLIQFISNNAGVIVGSISVATSSTSFNTSSDYRLKENESLISDGITRLKQLKPYRFNWKADSSTIVDGFFAHEVSSIVPESITGTKDAVAVQEDVDKGIADAIGEPIYQTIDQAKLVPLLVAAVQELITKVETLEAA